MSDFPISRFPGFNGASRNKRRQFVLKFIPAAFEKVMTGYFRAVIQLCRGSHAQEQRIRKQAEFDCIGNIVFSGRDRTFETGGSRTLQRAREKYLFQNPGQ